MLSYFQEDSQSGSSLADPLVANRVKNLYGMQTSFGVVCHPSFSFLTPVHAFVAFIVVLSFLKQEVHAMKSSICNGTRNGTLILFRALTSTIISL